MDHIYDDMLPDEEPIFQSESELKREIRRLERQSKKEQKWHDNEVIALREQIRDLLAKNMELSETCNLFARGLDTLKRDSITVTLTHYWSRKGVNGSLKERITQLVLDGKRIAAISPLHINPQGDMIEALIVTEHIEKLKYGKT